MKNNQSKLVVFHGATVGVRTRDLILTMDALYQLSYGGVFFTFPGNGTEMMPQCQRHHILDFSPSSC